MADPDQSAAQGTAAHSPLPPELAESLPYGPDRINAMNAVDWTVINPKRGEWTKLWTRRIER